MATLRKELFLRVIVKKLNSSNFTLYCLIIKTTRIRRQDMKRERNAFMILREENR